MVVIAVIGLLASIIFVGLSGARQKVKNARIMADLRQTKSIAELIYSTYNGYTSLVDGDHTLNGGAPDPYGKQLQVIEDDIIAMHGGEEDPFIIVEATTDTYCVSVALASSLPAYPEEGWSGWVCTDFEGATKLDYWCFLAVTPPYQRWCTPYPEPSAP